MPAATLKQRRAANRIKHHQDRIDEAPSSRSRLARVLDWIKAEARRLDDAAVDDLAEWAYVKASDLNKLGAERDGQ